MTEGTQKVYFATSKIYGKKTLYKPDELVYNALPTVIKTFTSESEAASHQLTHGTQMIDKYVYTYQEYYASMFQFDEEEIRNHMDANSGSIEGFGLTAKTYADWFIADFDHKDGIKGVIPQLSKALMYFDANNIEYYLYASGKKGLHLYIPMQYFTFPDQYRDKMHIVFSSIADWMEKEFKWENGFIDRLYNPVRMIRFPFSLHPDTGLIKTVCIFNPNKYNPASPVRDYLSVEDQITKDIAVVMRKQLFEPWTGTVQRTIEIVPEEKPVYENSPADVLNKSFIVPKGERMCVYTMLNSTNIEGHRRKIAMVLLFWLKEKGYPEELAFKFMEYWSSKLVKPLTHQELIDVFRYYGRYSMSCSHEDMRRYCPKSNLCSYWKGEMLSQKVTGIEDALQMTRELANESTATRFYFNEVIPGMKGFMSTKFGHIGCIAAASEVGKTWFILNILAKIKRMNFLFFSYEQSKYELLLRIASLLGLDINNPEEASFLMEQMSNIYIDDSGTTTLDEQLYVKQAIEEKHGIKIHCIVIDYIQLVPVEDRNFPGKFISNNTQAMVEVSKRIKTLAKREEHGYLCLSQVPKEASGNGNTMLTAEDMKDSQALNKNLTNLKFTIIFLANKRHTRRDKCKKYGNNLSIHDTKYQTSVECVVRCAA